MIGVRDILAVSSCFQDWDEVPTPNPTFTPGQDVATGPKHTAPRVERQFVHVLFIHQVSAPPPRRRWAMRARYSATATVPPLRGQQPSCRAFVRKLSYIPRVEHYNIVAVGRFSFDVTGEYAAV